MQGALHSLVESLYETIRLRVISRRDSVLCFGHLEQFLTDLVDELSALVRYYDLGATIPAMCM